MDQTMVFFMGPSIDSLMNPSMNLLMDYFINSSMHPLMDPSNATFLEHSGFDDLHQMILVCA